MDTSKQMIIVNGRDRTDSIASIKSVGSKCNITYTSSQQVYSYNQAKVRILSLQKTLDPSTVIFTAKGFTFEDIDEIQDFGDFYRIIRAGKKNLSYHKSEVVLTKNCLSNSHSKELFDYFKQLASAISLVTDNCINILERQYQKITAVSEETVLAKYLSGQQPVSRKPEFDTLIFPFGLNQSQKQAVENAFSSQISIIQGPPGTGKTQTILNIIANAVRNNKTVAVVSNNNSATQNVVEKLKKKDLSFLTAFLGSLHNKEVFLQSQTGRYPNMATWSMEREDREKVAASVKQLTEELTQMLNAKNRIAEINREMMILKPEQFYFDQYYKAQPHELAIPALPKLPSRKLIRLWLEYEFSKEQNGKISTWQKILTVFRFGIASLRLFKHIPEEAIPFLQDLYYKNRLQELKDEKASLESRLSNYQFDNKMKELSELSMKLFRAELAQRYAKKAVRPIFEKKDFRTSSEAFTAEYPVVLSTTYSIKGTLSTDVLYDYLIVDEASQVDLATGVLAFSCARNIVIVGDQKQLPNVLTDKDIHTAELFWNQHSFDARYNFSNHSMLASAAAIWNEAPSVLLREHYRCHPKIAEFFNQKFYNGELIVMTEDHGEKDVLALYRTVPGNHARGHLNQRQIDVIREEVLPALTQKGHQDIGIITPYRDQVAAIRRQLDVPYEIDTVHKFQGREKDAIILATVDNVIGNFVDDPNMLNVAVSRAVKTLSVVMSSNSQNDKTNYGDLARYISYNNFEIVDSQVRSVFDLLYKEYDTQRKQYLQKHKRVSEYDSENLAYSQIEQVIATPHFSGLDCIAHLSLANIVPASAELTPEESQYAQNPLTHLDFLLFRRMDKSPVLAIEVDGIAFHLEGSRQAERDALKNSVLQKIGIPLLRIKTTDSNIQSKLVETLVVQKV